MMQTITRKEQIELTASSLFKKKGFAATSMRDLASEIGIEAASLYSHVRSKEEILQKICFRVANEFFEAFETVKDSEATAIDNLRRVIIAHIEVLCRNTAFSAVFLHEWRHLSAPYLSDFLALRAEYELGFRTLLLEGRKEGSLGFSDEKFTVLTLLSSLNWIPSWYKPSGKMTPSEIGKETANILLSGLQLKN